MNHDYRARVAANEAAWEQRVLARQNAARRAKGEPEQEKIFGCCVTEYRDLPYEPIVNGDTWGPWKYDAEVLTLTLTIWPWYEIDLERMTTSAQMLDWIFQVSNKLWATVEVLGQLVKALDDLLKPQAHLCSFGASLEVKSVAAILERHEPQVVFKTGWMTEARTS